MFYFEKDHFQYIFQISNKNKKQESEKEVEKIFKKVEFYEKLEER